jgi:uncharacterized membrane protein
MTAWLAVVVGLSPSLAFVWEFKFDALPALLLVGGALLAYRERWVTAGAVLAVGAWTKWTPGLAVVALAAWLLASGRGRDAARHAGAFATTFVLLYVPFVAWNRTATFAAYHRQAGRSITAESMWYLLLRPAGLAHLRGHASLPAGAPHWATVTATGIQALLLVALVAIAARARSRAGAVAVAVLLPAVFLLTNRIFSPQFMLVAAPAFAVAGGLVLATRRAQLVLGVLIGVAAAANAIVYPYALPEYATYWVFASAVLFVSALGTCAWLVARARIVGEEQLAARTA